MNLYIKKTPEIIETSFLFSIGIDGIAKGLMTLKKSKVIQDECNCR